MDKAPIEPLSNAYRLLNPGSVVLVSVGDGDDDNLFAVTWNMPVRKDPGMLALLSGKRHHSYPFIARTGELGVNVPDASLADAMASWSTSDPRTFTRRPGRTSLQSMAMEYGSAPREHPALQTKISLPAFRQARSGRMVSRRASNWSGLRKKKVSFTMTRLIRLDSSRESRRSRRSYSARLSNLRSRMRLSTMVMRRSRFFRKFPVFS